MEQQTNPYDAPSAALEQAQSAVSRPSAREMLFSFRGRIRRTDYWLYSLGAGFVWGVLIVAITVPFALTTDGDPGALGVVVGGVSMLSYVPILWITSALQVKRWHDRGKSAWWLLLSFVPLLNLWALIEVGFLAGEPGVNAYGPDPKGGAL